MIFGTAIFLVAVVVYSLPSLRKLRSLLLVSLAITGLYLFSQQAKETLKENTFNDYPKLVHVLTKLSTVAKIYNPVEFEIFVNDVKKFVQEYKKTYERPHVQRADVLTDMRISLLNTVNYFRLSAPHSYDAVFEKALRILQATTYGMLKRLRYKMKDGGKFYPVSSAKNNTHEEFI